uniref:39S ribosomal protein L50, mitochondrial n=1 Tax=Parascaris equorum TaxID=6256 RepID=A0A914R710_PAREQ
KGALSKLRTDKPREVPRKAELSEFDSEAAFDASIDMDSIRARGTLKHTVPNAELHRMKTVEDVIEFYRQPTRVTAYPGSGGRVLGLRNKRLYRQFQPKKEWFDYEDQSFDYTRPDKDMPWDPEVAKRMDRYPSKKYILSKKAFERV